MQLVFVYRIALHKLNINMFILEIAEEESASFYIDEEEYLDLINEIKELKKKLAKTQREAIERDINTREEITEMFQEMMNKMESEYR